MSENVREIVFDALMLIDEEGRKSHLVVREVLNKYDYLDNADKNFIKRLTEGTVQKRITLDYVLDGFAERKMAKCKPAVREILRMAAYQILFMERVPDSAACDEAVKLCNKRSRKELSGFVNAVLRKVSENKDRALIFDDIEDPVIKLSVKYSLPEELVRLLTKEYDDGEALIAALSLERPTVVRIVDPSETDKIENAWKEKGISFVKSPIIENAYRLEGFHGAGELPGFDEGLVYIQDESSMLCVRTALEDAPPDPVILDLCAAPGGKSVYMAELLKGRGSIRSFDVSEEKVALLKMNMERLQFENVTCEVNDASLRREDLMESADIVVADVPCSGIGVISRKSDIKYNITNEGMAELCALQKKIALNAADCVKPGGLLVYSTCTLHKAENERTVRYILKNRPEFSLETERTLRPDRDDTDGFFVARLRKNG